jgi:preprotein translocase subunit Sec63
VFRVASFGTQSRTDGQAAFSPDRNPIQAFYDVLGLTRSATADDVRKAYRQLARTFHPDVNKSAEATAQMQQINTAYAILMEQFGEE